MAKNPSEVWFLPKAFGRGFVPVHWKGRLFTLLLLAVVLGSAYYHHIIIFADAAITPTLRDTIGFLVDLYIIIFASVWFMDRYTDGELKWRRGWKKENK